MRCIREKMQNTWKEKKFFVFVKFVRFVENEK